MVGKIWGLFSGGLYEVPIAAISLIDMAEKSRHSKAEKSRPIKTEKSTEGKSQALVRAIPFCGEYLGPRFEDKFRSAN